MEGLVVGADGALFPRLPMFGLPPDEEGPGVGDLVVGDDGRDEDDDGLRTPLPGDLPPAEAPRTSSSSCDVGEDGADDEDGIDGAGRGLLKVDCGLGIVNHLYL